MKSFTRASYASGSERRKIHEMVTGTGRYSPRAIARRAARKGKK
jgi:hypothetical protein